MPRIAYISGLQLGLRGLERLVNIGYSPTLVVGYNADHKSSSGYIDYSQFCKSHGVTYLQAANINSPDVIAYMLDLDLDLLVVAGWSQLLRPPVRRSAPIAVGFHPSPLPIGRGRAPIPWAILKEMRRSAVSLFHLDDAADAGDIVAQRWFDIGDEDDASSLYERVSTLQADLLEDCIPKIVDGTAPRYQQSGPKSLWPKRTPDDGAIDWRWSATRVLRQVRALMPPYPGAYGMLEGKRIFFLSGNISATHRPEESLYIPGTVIDVSSTVNGRGIGVVAGDRYIYVPEMIRIDGQDAIGNTYPRTSALVRPEAVFDVI